MAAKHGRCIFTLGLSVGVLVCIIYTIYALKYAFVMTTGNFKVQNLTLPHRKKNDAWPHFFHNSSDIGGSNTMKATKMKFGEVYILGVSAGNYSSNSSWDIFKVYATISRNVLKAGRLSCCFKYSIAKTKNYIKQAPVNVCQPVRMSYLTASHYTCKNPKTDTDILPDGVGITIENLTCREDHVTYVLPFFPLREQGTTLALSTKAAYGNISAELIIEWMETYIFLGVDKVVTHYLQPINKDALDVLKYYESTGKLDLYSFEPSAKDIYPRRFDNFDPQFWNDKQMVVYDAFEKLSGYTYFGQLDHDEFLIPSGGRSLKQLVVDLFDKHIHTAGFVFKTQYFYLSWGKSGDDDDLILRSYVQRPTLLPSVDNEKTIFDTSRVALGTIHTHWTKPSIGYDRIVVPREEGFIRHYRHCRTSKYVDIENTCMHKMTRIKDTSMAEWSECIRENVKCVRRRIFG